MTMRGKSSIGFSGFEKLTFLVKISKFSKISKVPKNVEGGAPALRFIRAGTWLTVHRSLPYRTAVNWRDLGPAEIRNFGRHVHVFSDILHQD